MLKFYSLVIQPPNAIPQKNPYAEKKKISSLRQIYGYISPTERYQATIKN